MLTTRPPKPPIVDRVAYLKCVSDVCGKVKGKKQRKIVTTSDFVV